MAALWSTGPEIEVAAGAELGVLPVQPRVSMDTDAINMAKRARALLFIRYSSIEYYR